MLPPPHVFALDRSELSYGAFHRSPQGWIFEVSRHEPLPEGLFPPGPLGAPMRDPRPFWELVQHVVPELPGPIGAASLVLPDSWLRLAFMESGELPRGKRERDEVLRFKLKRLVPFRVEELRLSEIEVTPFPNQNEPLRFMVGFAVDSLLRQLEDAFKGVGIELGRITNRTLALLAGLDHALGADELACLVLVERGDYTLSYFYGGEVVLYRYKDFGDEAEDDGLTASVDAGAVRRDLRLTSSFVRRNFPDRPLSRTFLAAAPEVEDQWSGWLAEELERAPEPIGFEHFALSRTQATESWLTTGPLLGAASIEVT